MHPFHSSSPPFGMTTIGHRADTRTPVIDFPLEMAFSIVHKPPSWLMMPAPARETAEGSATRLIATRFIDSAKAFNNNVSVHSCRRNRRRPGFAVPLGSRSAPERRVSCAAARHARIEHHRGLHHRGRGRGVRALSGHRARMAAFLDYRTDGRAVDVLDLLRRGGEPSAAGAARLGRRRNRPPRVQLAADDRAAPPNPGTGDALNHTGPPGRAAPVKKARGFSVARILP